MRLEELIKKREQELRIIKNTLGLGFPLVEERKMLRISFLELELADLYILRYEQPTLNENQQIVLEWLKRENFDSYIKSILSNLYFYVNMTAIGDLENEETQEMVNAYEELSQEDFARVLQAFSTWVIEQEEGYWNYTNY